MKLLLAFKSFMLRRPIVEMQQKLFRYRLRNSTVKTSSLQVAQFSSENWFAARATISTVNATSLQPTHFAAMNASSLQTTQFQQ
jgi:hypothetical protein